MRKLGKPDIEHVPRNEVEQKICDILKSQTNKDICTLKTKKEYMACHWDSEGQPVDPGYAYIVETSEKHIHWYCSGESLGVNLTDGDLVFTELDSWRK